MNVLVTGGAGFIGSHLVDKLLGGQHRVLVVDNLSSGKKENINAAADFAQLGIGDEQLEKFLADFQPEIIYHLAAQKNVRSSFEDPLQDAQTNIIDAIKFLQRIKKFCPKAKFVFVSTSGVYGEPQFLPITERHPIQLEHPYGLTKYALENYLRLLGMSYAIVRPANVYGPRQDAGGEGGVISIFIGNILAGRPCQIFGTGNQARDFIYVEDVVDGIIATARSQGRIYNLGTGMSISLLNLVDSLKKITGRDFVVDHTPAVAGDVLESRLDNTAAQGDLKWSPKYDLMTGLQQTWQWFEKKNK